MIEATDQHGPHHRQRQCRKSERKSGVPKNQFLAGFVGNSADETVSKEVGETNCKTLGTK